MNYKEYDVRYRDDKFEILGVDFQAPLKVVKHEGNKFLIYIKGRTAYIGRSRSVYASPTLLVVRINKPLDEWGNGMADRIFEEDYIKSTKKTIWAEAEKVYNETAS